MITKDQELIRGIVVNSKAYKEDSAIITIYTKDFGKISAIARGIKKIKSKNASACQSLTYSEFNLIVKKGLSTLIKANYLNFFPNIKADLLSQSFASYFCEYIIRHCNDNEPDEVLFNNLLFCLEKLELGYDPWRLYLLFNSYILKSNGCAIEVDSCVHCGSQSKIKGISLSGGGFVCKDCAGNFDQVYNQDDLRVFRHINKFELNDVDRLEISDSQIKKMVPVIDGFIDEYLGIKFKSRNFIRDIESL